MSVLSITSLAKSYRAGMPGCSAAVSVLRNVHLAVWPREIVALNGLPGCGKSTLLRCAAGLLHPDAGWVCWFGGCPAPRECVAYVGSLGANLARGHTSPRVVDGTLHARLERALARGARLVLVDDLATVSRLERRLALAMLRDHADTGASVILAANEMLAGESLVTRVMTLANGVLTQRRNRSATRIAASSFASRACASARSTY